MQIKVEYTKSKLEQAIANIKRGFTTEEFEPASYPVEVHGLKHVKREVDLSDLMNCEKQTGLTEVEYQTKYHQAWSE